MRDRTPPHNLDAEEAILGSMLESREAIATALERLKAEDFYRPGNQKIFTAILELYNRGDAVNAITLNEELRKKNQLDEVGGRPFLIGLLQAYSTVSAAKDYAEIIAGHSQLRRLIAATMKIQELAFDNPQDVPKLLNDAEAMVCAVAAEQLRGDRHMPRFLAEDIPLVLEALEADAAAEKEPGFTSGLTSLDSVIGGFQGGRYIVVGAATSKGKTSLLTQLMTAAARQDRRVLFVSLEQPRKEVIHRILAQEGDIYVSRLTNPKNLTEKDWTAVVDTASKLPLDQIMTTDGEVDLSALVSRIRRAVAMAQHLDVVVIDYVQLVRGGLRFANRAEEVSHVSRRLKSLANDLGLCIIAASQLNREFEKTGRRPILSDLRESGSLEHDPDLVMMLHRPEKKQDDAKNKIGIFFTELLIRKNRHGPTGIVETDFVAPTNTFQEVR